MTNQIYNEYGPEMHPSPLGTLLANMAEKRRGTAKQIAYLRSLCDQRGITEHELINLGVQQQRLHPDRLALTDSQSPTLEDLSFGEIGGLFAFLPWLRGEVNEQDTTPLWEPSAYTRYVPSPDDPREHGIYAAIVTNEAMEPDQPLWTVDLYYANDGGGGIINGHFHSDPRCAIRESDNLIDIDVGRLINEYDDRLRGLPCPQCNSGWRQWKA